MEKYKIYQKNYWKTEKGKEKRAIQNHKRRAAITGAIADLTDKQWKWIKMVYENRCVYCNRQMKRITMDHILPLSRGGIHTMNNIVPACQSCNSKKNTKTVYEWMPQAINCINKNRYILHLPQLPLA
ncbi:MAG: HNH endonuclease [Nanoarchaeota archaeon]|nr:HNH endonuclease [Nanoarchaeota archaeon]